MKISRKSGLALIGAIVVGVTTLAPSAAFATSISTDNYTLCLPSDDSTFITVTDSTPGDNLVWVFESFTNLGTWSTAYVPNKFVDLGPAVNGDYELTNESAQALATQAGVTEWPFQINLSVYTGSFDGSVQPTNFDYVAVGLNDQANPYTECTQPELPASEEPTTLPDTGRNSADVTTGILASVLSACAGVALVSRRRKARA
jgi:hypothetical protein